MTSKSATATGQGGRGLSRRRFVAGAGAAAAMSIIQPRLVRGSEANSKLRLGLIGCGGRGTWIANLFRKNGNYEFVAAADYFPDRVKEMVSRFQVDEKQCFTGLSGYKRLLDTNLDAVVIESPPYFHPEQAMAAVTAGRHVYLAKPIAVDVPGCLTLAEAGRKATEAKCCLLVDFQTRANELYQEAVRRVHAGDIGPIASGEAVYYTGTIWGGNKDLTRDPQNAEKRLRVWGLDRVLSGDIITEQNIHALDVATWIVGADPLKACGTCGKTWHTERTCNDYFTVVYQFPGDVALSFASKQYGTGIEEIGCRMFGPKGTIETNYWGLVLIHGEKSYKGGRLLNLYTDGAVQNIANFHAAITKGDWSNPTVPASVRSNLTTILGRMAAYQRAEMTWQQMLKSAEKLEFPVDQLKS